MNLSMLNSFLYTAGWFWSVIIASHRMRFLAFLGSFILILIALHFAKRESLKVYMNDLLLSLFSIPLGFLLETVFIQLGVLHYVNSSFNFPPLWIVLLYPLFSLLINHSLWFLKDNVILSFLFGFCFAPLSYIAGNSLDGLTFAYPLPITFLIIGIFWGFFLVFLTKLAKVIEKGVDKTFYDMNSNETIDLLYDGDCPLCNREICYLKTKENKEKLKFVDIASKDFSVSKYKGLDYETAMSQMHGVDSQGNLLVGLDAFAVVYAKSQLILMATILNLPFLRIILDPLYRAFAKNRLWITGRG